MNNNPSHTEEIDLLIIKHLSKECDKEETSVLRTWIMQSEENRRYFTQLQEIWSSISSQESGFDSEVAYQHFKSRIAALQPKSQSHKGWVSKPILRWAAAVILAFVLGVFSYFLINSYSISNKYYTISVPYGAKSKIELPDKSVVWLNAGSTLKYAQNFAQKRRNVTLSGEAYFEVTKNPDMPFTVQGKEVSVKVLGTKFNVKSYPEDEVVDVTLLQGAVRLNNNSAPDKTIMLKPNERATFNKRSNQLSVSKVEAINSKEWTHGKLIFEEELFGQIVCRLEREYNVRINIKNKELNTLRFYGDFRNAQSITEIFDIMTANSKFHYSIKESVINVFK
jgi:transmembrane sensor